MVDSLSLDDYVQGGSGELPINPDTMFADHKGVHKPRIEKKQRKLADKVTFLTSFLEEGEKLQAITTAVSPTSFFEQWTTGFIFVYLKRSLLVFTDRRILHIPTTSGFEYRESIAEIRYGDVKSIAQKGSRLKVEYKTGSKELFLYVRRSERKKIRALLQSADLSGAPTTAGKRVHLCPKCTATLEVDRYDCPSCSKEFKSRSKARNLSIWVPGGGYFYTGHPFLGIADAVIELFFIALIVTALMPSSGFPNGDFATAGIFAVFLIIEKAITVYHANHFVKEYLPADGVKIRRSPARVAMNAVGLVLLLGFIGLALFGVLVDTGNAPSERVLSAQDVPSADYQELVAAGVITEGEMIEYFYSEGAFSVTQGGSILTGTRVIAYEQNDQGSVDSYYVPNNQIVSVELVQQGDAMSYSVYKVNGPGEDNWIYLLLPPENGDGERFANAVMAKIQQ